MILNQIHFPALVTLDASGLCIQPQKTPGMVRAILYLLIIATSLLLPAPLTAGETAKIDSPADLWNGYDPEQLPLEKSSIKTWTENGAVYESLRFTSEVIDGTAVRVFAITGAPIQGDHRAGILHIHGGGQTASLDWVRFWVKRGYVCVTFDFCGPWADRTEVTDWGAFKQGNMQHAHGGLQVHPSPRESSWYHWTIAARRALTLLSQHPQVDANRLGVFGISVGGTLTWMVSGSDKRVKAAAPIYGCGYNYDRRNVEWGYPPNNDDLDLFQRVLGAEAHAPYVTCPVLFFDATNDFHGLLDRAYDTLSVVPTTTRQALTPRVNHHIAPEEAKNLPLWMDWHLNQGKPFPASPTLSIELDQDGIPQALIRAAEDDNVTQIDVFYSLGNKRPTTRFWRRAPATRVEGAWKASLPVMDTWDDLRAFANVSYQSGMRLSSNLSHAIPGQIGKAHNSLQRSTEIAHGTDGLDHWYFTASYTDPMLDWTYLRSGTDPNTGAYITIQHERYGDPADIRLSTHIIGDPQWRGDEQQALSLTVRGEFIADGLKLIVIEDDWGLRSHRYTANITSIDQSKDWKEIRLPLNQFTDAEGKSPTGWKVIDKLEIEAKTTKRNPPQFARLRWVSEK